MLYPGVSDLTGSFRLYKTAVLRHIITLTIPRGYLFRIEVMMRAWAFGYTVGSGPITLVNRTFGECNLGAGEVVQYAKGVWTRFTTVGSVARPDLLYNRTYRTSLSVFLGI